MTERLPLYGEAAGIEISLIGLSFSHPSVPGRWHGASVGINLSIIQSVCNGTGAGDGPHWGPFCVASMMIRGSGALAYGRLSRQRPESSGRSPGRLVDPGLLADDMLFISLENDLLGCLCGQ